MPAALSQHERELLDVAASFTALDERVTAAVMHERFGNATRAWQEINALLDTEEALAYKPALVHLLRRVRARRSALRSLSRSRHPA